MSAAAIVLVVGLVGLALVALLLVREPDARVRRAAIAGTIAGFLIAWAIALAAGKSLLVATATGALSAAALALVLIGQWLLIRALFARQGRRL